MKVENSQVAVMGLGISGYESALFLKKKGAAVWVTELQDSERSQDFAKKLQKQGIEVVFGKHPEKRLLESDFVVVSPGIPPQTETLVKLRRQGIFCLGDIELAASFCKGKMIGITGTNGKTTMSTLTHALLTKAGKKTFLCGNIGNPFIRIVSEVTRNAFAVIELSSFQLAYTQNFKPDVGVLLNIAPDHLNWHGNLERYALAKMKLFQNQSKEDTAILGPDPLIERFYSKEFRGQKVMFQAEPGQNVNEACLYKIAKVLGIKESFCREVLKEFQGIEHRLEFVCKKHNVSFVNDSKSTSLHSLEWALDKYNSPIVLICGGQNKGLDFVTMKDVLKQRVKQVIAIGEAKDEIEKAFRGVVNVMKAEKLENAVRKAYELAEKDDVVLFSPACASFDMFQNYEDRGKQFKKIVAQLKD